MTRAEEISKANKWFQGNLPEAVEALKVMIKAKGQVDATIKRLEVEARAQLKQPEKPDSKKP